jgi:hypothetical protein
MSGKIWLDVIPGKLTRMPVTHKPPELVPMRNSILGAVLHTTNSPAGAQTLERFQLDFQESGPPPTSLFRSAHFMVDRDGRIAQFRPLDRGSAHIGAPWNPSYFGIEHIAFHKQSLTNEQLNASADLLAMLKSEWGIPLSELSNPGSPGVGRHNQFTPGDRCGEGPFFDKGTFGPDFKEILKRALQRSPVGTWEVKVGDWTWIYAFKAGADFNSGTAEWRAFDVKGPSDQGTGTWKTDDTKLEIVWSNGSREEWNKPLSSTGQSGKLVKQGFADVPLTDRERAISARRTD